MNADVLRACAKEHGTPLFVYDTAFLSERARQLTTLSFPFGYTVRYAVKANSSETIIALFAKQGLYFDASSSYEAELLLSQHIPGDHISLSSQQPAHDLSALLERGVRYVATSLRQLDDVLACASPSTELAVRINPGIGSGGNNRTTTGGVSSSFGIWHDYIPEIQARVHKKNIPIRRVHLHVGSGADPKVWESVIGSALTILDSFPDATTLDIGGGYKIHRFGDEQETDMSAVASVFARALEDYYKKTNRKIHLEIEPGTWLVGHSAVLLAEVVDIVDTGPSGYTFLRTNTGMNDILRPSIYGAQHRIEVLTDSHEQQDVVIVGHNCESGDILTPEKGNPECIAPRKLNKASIGDVIAIYDCGAYCESMSTKGYNSFPGARSVFV